MQQPNPYGNCTETAKGSSWSTWLYGNQAYTAEGCRKSCLQVNFFIKVFKKKQHCNACRIRSFRTVSVPIRHCPGTARASRTRRLGATLKKVECRRQYKVTLLPLQLTACGQYVRMIPSVCSTTANVQCRASECKKGALKKERANSFSRTQFPIVTSQSRLSSYAYGVRRLCSGKRVKYACADVRLRARRSHQLPRSHHQGDHNAARRLYTRRRAAECHWSGHFLRECLVGALRGRAFIHCRLKMIETVSKQQNFSSTRLCSHSVARLVCGWAAV